ncbi:hypothetical protein OAD49_01645 [Flavobacteriaceae bacterium]|nr:hypothetical protein [Flavobacteriaceae bacterium]
MNIPIAVVNLPIFFDLVHPAKEITDVNERIPKRKKNPPVVRGNNKSSLTTLKGNPSVVIRSSLVIAKTVIKKKLAAKVDAIIILLDNRVFISDTKRLAIIAIENPPSKELINIVWSASLFQYSKVASIINLGGKL